MDERNKDYESSFCYSQRASFSATEERFIQIELLQTWKSIQKWSGSVREWSRERRNTEETLRSIYDSIHFHQNEFISITVHAWATIVCRS